MFSRVQSRNLSPMEQSELSGGTVASYMILPLQLSF